MSIRLATKSLILAMLVLPSGFLVCQNEATVQVQPSKTPPTLPVLYRFFLAYQLHLERKADALKQVGKNGEDLRTYYQKKLGFSDQEFSMIHQAAVSLETALQAKDEEAQKIIHDARALIPKGHLEKGQTVPAPPAILKTLQADREGIIAKQVADLRSELTPADVVKLESFLKNDFAPAVTVGTPVPVRIPLRSPLAAEGKQ